MLLKNAVAFMGDLDPLGPRDKEGMDLRNCVKCRKAGGHDQRLDPSSLARFLKDYSPAKLTEIPVPLGGLVPVGL